MFTFSLLFIIIFLSIRKKVNLFGCFSEDRLAVLIFMMMLMTTMHDENGAFAFCRLPLSFFNSIALFLPGGNVIPSLL